MYFSNLLFHINTLLILLQLACVLVDGTVVTSSLSQLIDRFFT